MYTGIIQALVPVESIDEKEGLTTFSIRLTDDLTQDLETGASIAINGVCFTVTRIDSSTVWFDAIRETLSLSNIKYLKPGAWVNFERSARANAEIGGHILAGHVVDTATVVHIKRDENNCRITFAGKPQWIKYVFDKGFLALNGASLTVAHVDRQQNTFSVNFIPETLQRTNFSLLDEGDEVNVEIEHQTQIIVDTVERVLQER
ncbi:MAG: riboflavin synthase subunit alpha [Pseudomonadales bacterium]